MAFYKTYWKVEQNNGEKLINGPVVVVPDKEFRDPPLQDREAWRLAILDCEGQHHHHGEGRVLIKDSLFILRYLENGNFEKPNRPADL